MSESLIFAHFLFFGERFAHDRSFPLSDVSELLISSERFLQTHSFKFKTIKLFWQLPLFSPNSFFSARLSFLLISLSLVIFLSLYIPGPQLQYRRAKLFVDLKDIGLNQPEIPVLSA